MQGAKPQLSDSRGDVSSPSFSPAEIWFLEGPLLQSCSSLSGLRVPGETMRGLNSTVTRRWPILLMLAVVAFQGGGLLHALHLSAEAEQGHEHDGEAVAAEGHCPGHTNAGLQVSSPVESSHAHQHDPATCGTCRGLAQFKSATSYSSVGAIAHTPPVFKADDIDIAWHCSDQLLSLAPRAPPTSSLLVCS